MTHTVRATYRLQFRCGFTFEDAARIAPLLASSGISHVYASPIFRAVSGSTHGYDVADHNEIEPAIGGYDGFVAFSDALKANGLGLILDIVPNHMAASSENPWWRDVLRHGEASPFARHFDIDWTAGKLILPVLGRPYGEALASGDITRATHPQWGEVLRIPGQDVPLAPGTEHVAGADACHEAQHYRITHWRLGRDGLTYRRFFEITGLVGVRVEEAHVFDDVHRLVRQLIEDGRVEGMRVDHVDGLSDPAGYLERLSQFGVPVWVEKILEPNETLPPWPVEGTTGYEFAASVGAGMVDERGREMLSRAYGALAGHRLAGAAYGAKRRIARVNLAGEFLRLTDMAMVLFEGDRSARDHGPDTVRRGLIALSVAMPVYRTYIAGEPAASDRAVVEHARANAFDPELDELRVVDDLAALILSGTDAAKPFVTRWQQTTGPLTAKAIEDTLFYRDHRVLALNEVGSHPDAVLGLGALDAALSAPGLAATQTHDTKRGEDARARLYQLTHPDAAAWWLTTWQTLPGDALPRWQWAMAQMWLGALPLEPDPDFADRFCAAVEKSAREAKEETSWTRQDPAFEARLVEAARAMAAHRPGEAVDDLLRAGAVAALAQALLKTFAHAVPDIYQGGFGWDFALVDPDNRRPVDFAAKAVRLDAARRETPEALVATWRDGRIKARVILEGLALRAEAPGLFASSATLERLSAPDSPVAAFWRQNGHEKALAVVAHRPFAITAKAGAGLDPAALGPVVLDLPSPVFLRFCEETIGPGPVDVSPFLGQFPVLLGFGRDPA